MIPRAIFFGLLFACCAGEIQHVPKEELQSYVANPENGLLKRVVRDQVTIEVFYYPKDLVIAQSVGQDSKQWLDEERRLDSLDYFILRLSRQGGEIQNAYAGDASMFNQVIAYLSDGIARDIHLLSGSRTLSPVQVLFVPTFGSASASSVMLAFRSSLSGEKDDFSLIFDDTVFGTGRNGFTFSPGRIREIPRLKRPDDNG